MNGYGKASCYPSSVKKAICSINRKQDIIFLLFPYYCYHAPERLNKVLKKSLGG
jgi:hypothetical protein